MIRFPHGLAVTLLVIGLGAAPSNGADTPPAAGLEVICLGEDAVSRVRIETTIEGTATAAVWDKAFAKTPGTSRPQRRRIAGRGRSRPLAVRVLSPSGALGDD